MSFALKAYHFRHHRCVLDAILCLLDAFWSVLAANWTCPGAIWKPLEPPWESFGLSWGGFRLTMWLWVSKSMIPDIVLEVKIDENLLSISSRISSHFGHRLVAHFCLILLSKMKASRRQRMTCLSGMLNLFAHCELLKTTVNYNTFWRLSCVARVF